MLHRIKEEVFTKIGTIYIEPFASRPPPIVQESSKSFGGKRNVENENFETLKCVATMGKGLEKTLRGLWQHFSPPPPILIVIIDFEQVENKAANQPIEVEQTFCQNWFKEGFLRLNFIHSIYMLYPPRRNLSIRWGARGRS